MSFADLLKSSPSARVINVASAAYRGSKGLQFDNLNSEKKFAGNLYPDTKLANVLFTKELSRRLSGTGDGLLYLPLSEFEVF